MNRYSKLATAMTVLAVVCSAPQSLRAQQSDDAATAIATAITAVRGQFATGATIVGIPEDVSLTSDQRTQIAKSLGMGVGDLRTQRVCVGGARSRDCKLKDAPVFVNVVRYSRSGESRVVGLAVYEETNNTYMPIHQVRLDVTVTKQGPSQWKVSSIKPISET